MKTMVKKYLVTMQLFYKIEEFWSKFSRFSQKGLKPTNKINTKKRKNFICY